MKNIPLVLIVCSSVMFAGCNVFPLKAEVQEGKFRFENFKRDKGSDLEYVNLMCFHNKPTSWSEPKQYEAGEHNLWVRASLSRDGVENSTREAIVNFKVDLDADKSYMLNRKREGEKIQLWIQEVNSTNILSNVIEAELKRPLIIEYGLRKEQCEAGSV
jgi:hypothetical protein